MGIQQIPLPSSGITVAEGSSAGWNFGAEQWEQISEYNTPGPVGTIDFTVIPQTYRKLILVINGMANLTYNEDLLLRINGDSGSNRYATHRSRDAGNNHTAGPYTHVSDSRIYLGGTAGIATNSRYSGFFEFPNYTSTNMKFIKFDCYYTNISGAMENIEGHAVYRTGSSTDAITSLRLYGYSTSFQFSSSNPDQNITLYGVK